MFVSIPKCLAVSKLSLLSTNAIPGRENKHGAMTNFLLTVCGFCESQLATSQRRNIFQLKSKSTPTAQQAHQFFTDSDFTFEEVRKTILKNPSSTNDIPAERNRHSAMTHFLKTEIGFSDCQLATIQRRNKSLFKSKSTRRAQQALQFLRDSGFTLEQVRMTILRNPSFLQRKVDGQLNSKLQLLKTLGLTDIELAHIISQQPRILGLSLDKALHPKISILLNFFGSKDNLCKAITRNPRLLLRNVERQLDPVINMLKQSGIEGDLLLYLLSRRAEVLLCNSEESLKLKIEYVRNMGILEGSKAFVVALAAVEVGGLKNLKKKLKLLASRGLSEGEIKLILMKFPVILGMSMDKIRKNMKFVTHTAGFQPNILITHPLFLGFNVEYRMYPRYKVFEYLRSMQPGRRLPSLATVLNLTEENFGEKFLSDNPQIAEVYENYKGKSVEL